MLMRATLILDSVPRDGAHQMATDLALMHRATAERSIYLRLYRWEPHCLSFGAHEPALRRYDRAAIDRLGIDTVRRPTGGRAVWHARELTYAVTAADGAYGTLRHAYLRIHEALARAVAALGAAPVLAPPTATAALGSGACFASAAEVPAFSSEPSDAASSLSFPFGRPAASESPPRGARSRALSSRSRRSEI